MARIAVVKTVAAYLDLIAKSEGTSTSPMSHDDGYDIIVSGVDGHHTFSDYSDHPFALGRPPIIVRPARAAVVASVPTQPGQEPEIVTPARPELRSTASGRYQIIWPTWHRIANARGLRTFNPQNQDIGAMELLKENDALALIENSKIALAIEKCAETWASFPGNEYAQGGRSLEWLLETYTALLAAQP